MTLTHITDTSANTIIQPLMGRFKSYQTRPESAAPLKQVRNTYQHCLNCQSSGVVEDAEQNNLLNDESDKDMSNFKSRFIVHSVHKMPVKNVLSTQLFN